MNSADQNPKEKFTPRISNFRQPMVTATGIFLGFLLNFAVNWIGDAFTKYMVKDLIIGISIAMSLGILMNVLYRILNMKYPTHDPIAYYQNTLKLFLAGISIPFISFVLVIVHRLMTHEM